MKGLYRGKSTLSAEKMEYHEIPHDNGWVKGYYLDGYICGEIVEVGEEFIAPRWWCKVEPETIGRYTGLKDRKGAGIYEGDIACDRYANFYTPIFRNGIYMAYNVEHLNLSKQEPSTQFNMVWKNGCEVIGNIYDNPELLGVEP